MRSLHAIAPTEPRAYIWANPYTMHGRPLGGGWLITTHAYELERGLPPAIGTTERRIWYPYNMALINNDRNRVITPACGRIRTTSRRPQVSEVYNDNWRINMCEDCQRLVGETTTYVNVLRGDDPYFVQYQNTPRTEREFLTDPVSGL